MTDASSTPSNADGDAAADGGTDAVDDRPERPPSQGLVETLGVVDHAKRGLAVGVALAVAVFAFFVVLPIVDPSTPARAESPVLYVALAFVVATSGTLLVASALAVRAVAGRVMAYEKWVRRGATVGAIGGLGWALTGALAFGLGTDLVVPESVEPLVLATLPLPVLFLAVGAWSALARTGGAADDRSGSARNDQFDDERFDHVLARPRLANAGAVLVLVGVGALHVATFLETGAFLGDQPSSPASAVTTGTVALAAGTAALATVLDRTVDGHVRLATATALATVGGIGAIVVPSAVAFAATVLLGLAWVVIGATITGHAGTYPERPI